MESSIVGLIGLLLVVGIVVKVMGISERITQLIIAVLVVAVVIWILNSALPAFR